MLGGLILSIVEGVTKHCCSMTEDELTEMRLEDPVCANYKHDSDGLANRCISCAPGRCYIREKTFILTHSCYCPLRFLENRAPNGWSGTNIHKWCEDQFDGASWPSSIGEEDQSLRLCNEKGNGSPEASGESSPDVESTPNGPSTQSASTTPATTSTDQGNPDGGTSGSSSLATILGASIGGVAAIIAAIIGLYRYNRSD